MMVALFSAAMSSLDSTINSLSAATQGSLRTLRSKGEIPPQNSLSYLVSSLFWGSLIVFFAFFVGDISDSVITSVNKIGSLANGPFGDISPERFANEGATTGLVIGLLGNAILWKFAPRSLGCGGM